jgi:peptide chain release factor 3
VEKLGRIFNAVTVKDQWGRPVVLFRNEYALQQLLLDEPGIKLSNHALPPLN